MKHAHDLSIEMEEHFFPSEAELNEQGRQEAEAETGHLSSAGYLLRKEWAVVGCCRHTGKERVVRTELSREEAEAIRTKMRRDPLCAGFSIWIQRSEANK